MLILLRICSHNVFAAVAVACKFGSSICVMTVEQQQQRYLDSCPLHATAASQAIVLTEYCCPNVREDWCEQAGLVE